jgi:hypothetical protein
MQIKWLKVSDTLIQSDCGNYSVKKLDRGHVTLFAAEIRISEICYLANWLKLSAEEAKQACLDGMV